MITNKLLKNHATLIFWFYSVVVVLLCILPINGSESSLNNTYILNIRFDYLVHIFLFIPWMLLWKLYSKTSFHHNIGKTFGVISIGLLFAFGSELIQYFLPYRTFNINDLMANIAGIGIGIIFFIK